MSIFAYFKRFVSNLLHSVADDQVNDVDVPAPRTNKRRQDENLNETVIVKRKKIDQSDLEFSRSMPNFLSKKRKESNGVIMKKNSKMNDFVESSTTPPVNTHAVYCIDDEDDDSSVKQYDLLPKVEENVSKQFNARNKLVCGKLNSVDDNEEKPLRLLPPRTYSRRSLNVSRSNLSLMKLQNLQGKATYVDMLRKHAGSTPARKSIPLTNSTIHNMKQNSRLPQDFLNNRTYSYHCQMLKNMSPAQKVDSPSTSNETAFDKTVIDLTADEDDDDQRQTIESNVADSSAIKNLKSNFVAQDSTMLNEDFISDLLKKYDRKMQNMKLESSRIQKTLRDNKEEFNKTLSEILEKRLTLKENSESEESIDQKPSYETAPITKQMIAEINQILTSRKVPLVQIKDTSVKAQDIRTLENTSWLNDEVINAYMNLIKIRAEKNPQKYAKVHCFNTFLYEQLHKKGYNSVRRWTKKIDIFSFKILIIPIHLGNHWCLVQVRLEEKSILYYDSMGSPNNRCLKTIVQYLADEYQDKKNDGSLDTSDWRLTNVPSDEIPQQRNAHDCGVFACTYAEHITRNARFNFDQEHMPYFRIKMMYEILTGSLLL